MSTHPLSLSLSLSHTHTHFHPLPCKACDTWAAAHPTDLVALDKLRAAILADVVRRVPGMETLVAMRQACDTAQLYGLEYTLIVRVLLTLLRISSDIFNTLKFDFGRLLQPHCGLLALSPPLQLQTLELLAKVPVRWDARLRDSSRSYFGNSLCLCVGLYVCLCVGLYVCACV